MKGKKKNKIKQKKQKEKSVKLIQASHFVSPEYKTFLSLFSSSNTEHTLLTLVTVSASYKRSKITPASWTNHCSAFALSQKKHNSVQPRLSH